MNVFESVQCGANLFPDQAALIAGDHSYSYAQLEQLAAHAAGVLHAWGVARGDRVALVLPNVPAFPIWYYGTLRLGATAVSVSTRLTAAEMAYIISDSGAKVVICSGTNLSDIGRELPSCVSELAEVSASGDVVHDRPLTSHAPSQIPAVDLNPDTPAVILYTSGTTGFPKGATLSHRNIRATVHAFNHLCGMRPGDRLLIFVPLFHCYGQNALLNAGLNVGATLVLQERFDLNETRRLIGEQRVNRLFGVPTTFQLLHDSCDPSELESVAYCFSAAATLPIQLAERWQQKFGRPIYEGYGLTETAPFASYNHRLQHVPGSIGTPVDLVEMKIVDPDTGADCRPGTLGEIVIRGPNVMLGYWNRPDETAAAIRDGWFHSGDIGRQDERGYFYIVDRLKDMISVGALKVFPAEVERVLLDHPAVAEAAVVGFPDPVFEEKVVAFITAGNEPPDVESIRRHCRQFLADYKVPGHVEILDELPRVPSGKVRKTTLREMTLSAPATPAPSTSTATRASGGAPGIVTSGTGETREATGLIQTWLTQLRAVHPAGRQRELQRLIQQEVQALTGQPDPIDLEQPLLQAGLDSLMIVELTNRLQQHIGSSTELPATLVFDHPRICDVASFLVDTLESQLEAASGESTPRRGADAVESRQDASAVDDSPHPVAGIPATETASEGETSRLASEIAALSDAQALEELLRELNES